MKYKLLFVSTILLFCAFTYNGGDDKKFNKKLDDDNHHYTDVGNIGLTITNFGTYGHGFSLWPEQPSCEYPLGSGIEHIFDGGLWVGGYTSNDSTGSNRQGPYVTTGAVDASSVSARGGGFEFTNSQGSMMTERSSLSDSRYYDPKAISHQDFVCDFTDTNKTLLNGEVIEGHNPARSNCPPGKLRLEFSFRRFFRDYKLYYQEYY